MPTSAARQTSSASTIASTAQQMSISFGVATASLVTALFIPDRFHSAATEMIHGIHQAFLVLVCHDRLHRGVLRPEGR